ncbi:MAG: two-component system response regulator [SAR86 cluster bacterium]|uniref:Two-component system response regulator n=1 Tax=SAR86 cluster bacterium TaxID=2030880 RepID=A0A2A5AVS8_9GAMM|nr:MAG: two-component system response regulator [SAR86 cluster bacterium]
MAKILFIDDDQAIRDLVTLRLQIAGHDVTLAENGKIGVEAALLGSYDLILMDMHMPIMSGHEAVKILRDSSYTGLIVALTASVMISETNEAIAAGCDDIIVKPMTEEFEEQVATLIQNHIRT